MDSEEEVQRLKRAGQDVKGKPAKRQRTEKVLESVQEQTDELSQEQLNQMVIIVPNEGINGESLQTKYPIIGWEVHSNDTMQFWKIIRVGNHTEVYQVFEDMLKNFDRELQKYMHDPLKWWLYDMGAVHHVSTEKGQDISMLVEKDYPLIKGLATLMLSNKLRVDQQSEMADELLTKIYNIANRPRN
ncbi:hypothetical protein Tco_1331985 [Tanacetum coccineum]